MEHCLRVCTATAVRCLVVLLNAIRAYHLQALSSIDALLPRIEEAATNAGITTSAASSSEPVPDNGLVTDIP
ncbi:hypothetical protein H696_05339 [Fonticula alba]|uniref:Uncharacterized protein n=1 Tax=Fonticula alba TaxID=691883 RepID=A0A058Z3J5_FONAL|nr:hypothetical protein H696_05339 [Fonticula alba]KCV68087.1 hypothetical protein H696_05339 [Fonticula alba]|eukprot:XP_009497461.1 hypothetical protein H696_05339 [Fonticula alba]